VEMDFPPGIDNNNNNNNIHTAYMPWEIINIAVAEAFLDDEDKRKSHH